MNTASVHNDIIGEETLSIISTAGKFNRWMYDEIRPYLRGRILESGSGIGNISGMVLKEKFETVLSDYNTSYITHLQKKFAGIPNLKDVVYLNLQDIDFEKKNHSLFEKFDNIFLLNVIEHLENDAAAVSNCKYMLKQGGRLILLAPAYPFLFCKIDENLGHFRRYTVTSLAAVLEKNQLEIIEKKYFNLAGIAGWFIWGKLLKKKKINAGSMYLFNKIIPLARVADKIFLKKIGLSAIVAGKKT